MSSKKLSPTASRIIRYAFGLEIVTNTIFGTLLIANPAAGLAQMARSPQLITPTTTLLAQLMGGFILSFNAPLALGLRGGPKERKLVYWTLAAGEAAVAPVLLGKYLSGADSGMKDAKELLTMAGQLLVLLGWRVWCLKWRPEWFGVESGHLAQD